MTTEVVNTLMNIDDFLKLDTVSQRNSLLHWRNTYTNKEILKGMSISSVKFYELVREFNLPRHQEWIVGYQGKESDHQKEKGKNNC